MIGADSMKKIIIALVVALMPLIVFADTKDDILSLSNRMYVLEKELLNPKHDNNKSLEDIKYIRSISGHITKALTNEYKENNDLEERTIIGNSVIAAILYQLSLDHAEQYIKTGNLDQLSNMISKISLADLIVKSIN